LNFLSINKIMVEAKDAYLKRVLAESKKTTAKAKATLEEGAKVSADSKKVIEES